MKNILLLFALTISLTAADKGTPLFDGKTLKGWTPAPGGKWQVQNGAIVGTSPRTERRHGILLTDKQFSNFVVKQ